MGTERRSKVRYPLELAVDYQAIERGSEINGTGRTLNVSSSGLLMVTQHAFNAGMRLKLIIEWPSLLNGTTPLQLVTRGRVVRQWGPNVAVVLEQYQFRTKRRLAPLELTKTRYAVAAAPPPTLTDEPLQDRRAARATAAGLGLRSAS